MEARCGCEDVPNTIRFVPWWTRRASKGSTTSFTFQLLLGLCCLGQAFSAALIRCWLSGLPLQSQFGLRLCQSHQWRGGNDFSDWSLWTCARWGKPSWRVASIWCVCFGFFQQAQKFWKTFDGYTKWVLPSAKVGRIPLPVWTSARNKGNPDQLIESMTAVRFGPLLHWGYLILYLVLTILFAQAEPFWFAQFTEYW